ncbi:LamG-like jellyroll fold domain-containing protein [Stackebrandtia soli]|uniref:LamG domain-containing protein n=1 Tax=Stackebrandtia soli TaxID=1892856 RepID=UPI0039EAF99F
MFVRRPDGEWVSVDPTLITRPDGSMGPTASTIDLWFPSAGTEPTVVTRFGDDELALTLDTGSATVLPEPVISGDTATYIDVVPGVDLVLTADVSGFSHTLIVKTPEAATSPVIRDAVFETTTTGLDVTEGDGETVEVTDPETGSVVLTSGSAMMWDSAGDDVTRTSSNQAPRVEPMTVSVTDEAITLTPSADMLDDPSTVYPVYIDPTWTSKESAYATLTDNEGSVYNQPHPPVNADEGKLKVGFTDFDKVFRARSLLRMPLSNVNGKIIESATFSTTQGWSALGCGQSAATGLYAIPTFSAGTTWSTSWNSSGSGWSDRLDTNSEVRRNGDTCAPRPVEWTATSAVRDAVASNDKYIYLGLKAENESNHNAWKKYRLDAELRIAYNTPPGTPSSATIDGDACVSGDQRPVTSDSTPTFKARVTDTDEDTLTAGAWWKPVSEDWTSAVGVTQDRLKTNTYLSTSPSDPISDGTYSARFRTTDAKGASGPYLNCEFTVDTVAPSAPTVQSTDYPDETTSKDGAGGIGQTGSFTIVGPPSTEDIDGYLVTLNEEDPTRGDRVPLAGQQTSMSVTPTRADANVLRVWSTDMAGNLSTPTVYRFIVDKNFTDPVARWSLESLDGGLAVDDSGNGHDLTGAPVPQSAPGRLGVDKSAAFDGGTALHTNAAVVDMTQSFSVSAWVRLESRSVDRTVMSVKGNDVSAMYLKYRASSDRWLFTVPSTIDGTPTWADVWSTGAPGIGVWTHLLAGYDAATGELFLYVDGALQGRTTAIHTVDVPGELWVGTAAYANDNRQGWLGRLDDLRIWDRVVVPSEAGVYGKQAAKAARWKLNGISGTSTDDDTVYGNSLTWTNGVGSGADGTSASFDGSGCAVSDVIVPTASSFSVSAWVFLEDKRTDRVAVAQSGTVASAFTIGYDADLDDWAFTASASDSSGSPEAAAFGHGALIRQWTHLVAAYDASDGTVQMYVNGSLTGTADIGPGWDAPRGITVGCADPGGEPRSQWLGGIDDVHVFGGTIGETTTLTDSETVTDVMAGADRLSGDIPDVDRTPSDIYTLDFDAGYATLSALTAKAGSWSDQIVWQSSTSDYFDFYTTMTQLDVNGDGLDDVALIHERHEYYKSPTSTNSVISARYVTVEVLIRDEYGLWEQPPAQLDSTMAPSDGTPAPPGPWMPAATYITAGDIDGDGDDDLVATPDGRSCTGSPRLFTATDGSLASPVGIDVTDSIDWCLATNPEPSLSDVNGDGAADLTVYGTAASGIGARVATYRADGADGLSAPSVTWSSTSHEWNSGLVDVTTGHVNASVDDDRAHPDTGVVGPGFIDRGVMRRVNSTGSWRFDVFITVPYSTGAENPVSAVTPTVPVDAERADAHLMDVDGDGDADLVVVYRSDTTSIWLYSNDNGDFGPEQLAWESS